MFLRYTFVGISSYFLYLGLLVLQVEYLYISPTLASVFAFIPAFFFSYVLTSMWVFSSGFEENVGGIYKYATVIAIGLFWNVSVMYLTTEMMGWHYIYSQVLVFIVVGMNNFLFNKFWVFSKEKK